MRLFTIASDLPFLDALVAGLRADSGDDPLALARITILLPTRRAARALGEAFLRASSGRALLLPRLVPVGDVDAEELALGGDDAAAPGGVDIPPAVPELQRQLALTRLVLAWGQASGSGPLTPGQAAPLALALSRFLDEVETEGSDFARLAELVPAELAQHWQQVLHFLAILTEHWPRHLAELGGIDPATRRNLVLRAQAEVWRCRPPATRIIAAGLTGGVAAVAELMAVVATLPQGAVVLPGLDRGIGNWDAIAADPAHPQHLLALLLRRLGTDAALVADWPAPGLAPGSGARRRLVAEALLPAAESHRWRGLAGLDQSALDGLMRLDCAGPAGRGGGDRAAAARGVADAGEDGGAHHPRSRPGASRRGGVEALGDRDRRQRRRAARQDAARPLPAPGARSRRRGSGAAAAARGAEASARRRRPRPRGLPRAGAAAGARGAARAASGAGLCRACRACCRRRAISPRSWRRSKRRWRRCCRRSPPRRCRSRRCCAPISRPPRRWRRAMARAAPSGCGGPRRASRRPSSWPSCWPDPQRLPPIAGRDYPALFAALIARPVVRPRYGRHPRLAIWGLLEARLQQADLVILGGLNEGVWPPDDRERSLAVAADAPGLRPAAARAPHRRRGA